MPLILIVDDRSTNRTIFTRLAMLIAGAVTGIGFMPSHSPTGMDCSLAADRSARGGTSL